MSSSVEDIEKKGYAPDVSVVPALDRDDYDPDQVKVDVHSGIVRPLLCPRLSPALPPSLTTPYLTSFQSRPTACSARCSSGTSR